ncbi:ferrous iron transport protein A [Sphingomonas sp. AP4-R1]|uniref:FeoA family protein n=1 Tax=Sphingomonas sp. AP4-R1 TaxID=2735134 RepID=UPI001493BB47|nr:FeoA family protein [Sphingomonas sp. AP4-R1]QJU59999.1 ferrous iron transport protein A [Sphingomonas sp. AP4-R1]
MRLDELPPRRATHIAAIDWDALDDKAARRLRELGFDEGVTIETLHRGPVGLDPIAVRVGKMTIALRKVVANAVTVTPA